jgi:hypothetical protein
VAGSCSECAVSMHSPPPRGSLSLPLPPPPPLTPPLFLSHPHTIPTAPTGWTSGPMCATPSTTRAARPAPSSAPSPTSPPPGCSSRTCRRGSLFLSFFLLVSEAIVLPWKRPFFALSCAFSFSFFAFESYDMLPAPLYPPALPRPTTTTELADPPDPRHLGRVHSLLLPVRRREGQRAPRLEPRILGGRISHRHAVSEHAFAHHCTAAFSLNLTASCLEINNQYLVVIAICKSTGKKIFLTAFPRPLNKFLRPRPPCRYTQAFGRREVALDALSQLKSSILLTWLGIRDWRGAGGAGAGTAEERRAAAALRDRGQRLMVREDIMFSIVFFRSCIHKLTYTMMSRVHKKIWG